MVERSKCMNVPEIRFKGFHKQWESNTIGEISNSYSGGTPSVGCNEFYGGNIPFIRSGEIYNDTTELYLTPKGLYSSSAKIVDKGTILYALYGATSGEVNICKIRGAINQAILAIIPKKNINNYYLLSLLRNKKIEIIGSLLQGGQGNLSGTLIKKYLIFFPELPEQQKIASYFQSLDSLIQITSKKLASLKQIKAASLQSMFPQEGETVPKVRFKGFEGGWDNNLISNVCKIITGKSNTQDQVKNGLYPFFIRSENIVRSNKYLYDCEAVITIGDGNIGRVFHYINGKFDLHQRCYMMRNFRNVSALYFYYYFSAFFYDRAIKMSAKATVDSVRLNMIADMNILYPKNKLEQQKIASYFCNLDKQISLQTQRLEKLKQIKAACLDKMFV